MARKPKKPSQPTNQEARDAVSRAIERDRYASSINVRVLAMLLEIEEDISARLGKFDPQDPNNARRIKRLKQLEKETAEEIKRRYADVAKEATGELPELAKDEARWKQKSIQNAANASGADIPIALAPDSILEALIDEPIVLGGIAADYWKSEGTRLSEDFARQMRMGVGSGENIQQLVSRVRGTRANNYSDGIMAVSKRNATALVRTSVTSIAEEAQMAVFDQNADIIQGVQQCSVMDTRTTVICSARHGKVWKREADGTWTPIGHDIPFAKTPIHWQCRSIHVSVFDVEEPPPPLPDFKTYFDGLSLEDQNRVFGVGRAALFREGRIGQKDLLSTNGNPLTLKQLVEQHGAPVATTKPKTLKQMLDSDWNSVTMEDVLTNGEFVLAERAALSAKPTLADENDIPDGFFDKRRYARLNPDTGKVDPLQPYDVDIDETLLNIRKVGEGFAGDGGPLYERKAVIVLGPPAAGKSTLAESISKGTRSAIVDVDEAKKFAPEYNGGLGASAVHTETAVLTDMAFESIYREGMNVVLPKVGATVKSIQKTIDKLRANGYDVDIVNLNVSQDEAARRMGARFVNTGRLIPSGFYRSIGNKPTITFNELKRSDGVRSYAEVDANGAQGDEQITEGQGWIATWLRRHYGR